MRIKSIKPTYVTVLLDTRSRSVVIKKLFFFLLLCYCKCVCMSPSRFDKYHRKNTKEHLRPEERTWEHWRSTGIQSMKAPTVSILKTPQRTRSLSILRNKQHCVGYARGIYAFMHTIILLNASRRHTDIRKITILSNFN